MEFGPALNTLTEACERFADISHKANDLWRGRLEHGLRYQRAYFSEHRKLLLLAMEQKKLIAENERLKDEIKYLRQSTRLRDKNQEMQAMRRQVPPGGKYIEPKELEKWFHEV
ncbi:hypothetical protein EJ07DRAFT_170283 [Lizonia empirigonia]|nr:hypothetical protein EJ07DRAFT_170283 [Lizonia empirigonia]